MEFTRYFFMTLGLLAGCAGTPFQFDTARQVKVGMTDKQLTELMGTPYMVTTMGDKQIWVWSEANFMGGSQTESFTLQNGKVTSVPAIPDSFH
ncbi:MAG TPA: outer membrane protein assembly factor BamE [Gemmataceae bacterium]|nr:outer membrane protein assembly factor BamE [Gemmataceae bacterium]